jgi:hypothetical protein
MKIDTTRHKSDHTTSSQASLLLPHVAPPLKQDYLSCAAEWRIDCFHFVRVGEMNFRVHERRKVACANKLNGWTERWIESDGSAREKEILLGI